MLPSLGETDTSHTRPAPAHPAVSLPDFLLQWTEPILMRRLP